MWLIVVSSTRSSYGGTHPLPRYVPMYMCHATPGAWSYAFVTGEDDTPTITVACTSTDQNAVDGNDIALYVWWGIIGAGGTTRPAIAARDQLQSELLAKRLTHDQVDFLATIDLAIDLKLNPAPLSNWWHHLPRLRDQTTSRPATAQR